MLIEHRGEGVGLIRWSLASILFFVSSLVMAAPAKKIHFVTYELPPYIKKDLPEGGAVISSLKRIFKKQGYDLQVKFVPAHKVPKQAILSEDVTGYFPEVSENLPKNFILSRTVQQSTWGMAERVDHPITWKNYFDLGQYRIGNVVGYELAGVLKPLREKGLLQIEDVHSDEENLLKLARGSLDLAFIDMSVFDQVVHSSKKLRPLKSKLRMNPRPLQVYQYGLAFKKSPEGKEVLRAFNSGFVELEFLSDVEAYLRKHQALLQ